MINLPLSLIVCVHNEEKNLPFLLDSLKPLKDDEVLIVLDRCTDLSEQIVDRYSDHLPLKKIKILNPEWIHSPKKWAIFTGISESKNPYLVFTDADCILPESFFSQYRSEFNQTDMIIGYSLPAENTASGFLQNIQWFDSLFTAVKYTFFFNLKCPYMSVGRNWGFKKQLFRRDFLESHAMIKSGDDDLLFQKVLTLKPKVGLLKLNVQTTGTKSSLKELINQKARHYKAGTKYPPRILMFLAVYDLMLPGLIMFFAGSLWLSSVKGVILSSILILIFISFISFKSLKLLSELGIYVSSVTRISLFALFYHFMQPFFSVFLQALRPKWKS